REPTLGTPRKERPRSDRHGTASATDRDMSAMEPIESAVAPYPGEEPKTTPARAHILVVDDDAEMCGLLCDVLRREGFASEDARSADEPLPRLAAQDFDLIVTDLKMAHLDGMELLSRVRELRPEVGVILITAFGGIDVAIEAMRRGAAHFLTKPVKMKEL